MVKRSLSRLCSHQECTDLQDAVQFHVGHLQGGGHHLQDTGAGNIV